MAIMFDSMCGKKMLATIENACLVMMNIQNEIIPALRDGQQMISDWSWLAELASEVGIPTVFVNHRSLGENVEAVKNSAKNPISTEVTNFSVLRNEESKKILEDLGRKHIVLVGCEAHISIYQSSIDLKNNGYNVFVVSNAITSRNEFDLNMFKNRCLQLGMHLVSKEMIFCALLKGTDYPNFGELCTRFLGYKVYC